MARLTILGLYRWSEGAVFDGLKFPDGVSRETLISQILERCGNLELVYPSLEWMKYSIEHWSAARMPTWQRVQDALTLEYNPIENYDRFSEWTRENDEDSSVTGSTSTSSEAGNERSVQGFDSEQYEPAEKSDSSSSAKSSDSSTGKIKRSESYNEHTHGNIGVTTSQQMLEAELDVAENNIYDYICNDFRSYYCLEVF